MRLSSYCVEWTHQLWISYKKKCKNKKSCQKGLIDDIFYYQIYCLPITIRDEKLSLIDKIKIIYKIFVTRGHNCIYPCAKFIYLIIKLIDLSPILCFVTETFLKMIFFLKKWFTVRDDTAKISKQYNPF